MRRRTFLKSMLTAVALPCTRWFDPLTVPLKMPPKPRWDITEEILLEGITFRPTNNLTVGITTQGVLDAYAKLLLKDEEDEHHPTG